MALERSKLQVLLVVATGGILHGMHPPLHLWAVTLKGMAAWAGRAGVNCKLWARHLGVLAYSPHYVTHAGLGRRLSDWIGQQILSRIRGGTHLVAALRQGKRGG